MTDRSHPWVFVRSAVAWLLLLFLLLPVFMTIPFSLSDKRYLSLPEQELSLRPFATLFSSRAWLHSLIDSALIAMGAMIVALILGVAGAIGLWRLRSRLVNAIRAVALAPLILPQILSALAYYRLFVDLGILDTRLAVVLAHGILATPFVIITVSASLASFDPALERAARSLGAGLGRTIWSIFLPIIRPGILAGAVFAFLTSWDELVVSLFITGTEVITVPRRIFSGLRESADPAIAACATVLIIATLLIGLGHSVWLAIKRHRANRPRPDQALSRDMLAAAEGIVT